jgi:hypothetical protein
MSKINILNLVLSIIVITLAIVIYYSEEPNTQLDRLTEIDVNSIRTIDIQHNKNKTNLIKHNQRWEITQPTSIAANDFRINSLLKLLNAPVHSQYSVDEVNLADTGLEKSATKISFDGQEITFGTHNTATELRYIQLNNSVFTIEDVYYPLISSNFSTLVSFNLLPNDSHIKKLILRNQTITKNLMNFWQSNIKLTADNLNKVIDDWKTTQAFGVHEYLKREKLGEVFVYLENTQEPITFIIADDDPWLILARPELGLEYHLNIEAYNKLIEPKQLNHL